MDIYLNLLTLEKCLVTIKVPSVILFFCLVTHRGLSVIFFPSRLRYCCSYLYCK